MIAWVSPAFTVRSTPRRISRRRRRSVSTVTCRSRISRVAIRLALYVFRVRRRRGRRRRRSSRGRRARAGWRAGRSAGRCAGRSASRAASTRCVWSSTSPSDSGDVGVRADVVDRVDLAVAAHDRDRHAVDDRPATAVPSATSRDRAGPDVLVEVGHVSAPRLPARPRPAASSRSSTSGMPIWLIRSAKKPRTTRRRASSAGMPRDCR